MIALSIGQKETLKLGDKVFLLFDPKKPADAISFRIDLYDTALHDTPGASSASSVSESAATSSAPAVPSGDNSLAFGRYRILKTLGRGSFAQVKLAFDIVDNSLIALKFINKYVHL